MLFLTGSAAALLNRFSFIPSPFHSTLLNQPCQQVDPSLEQNKIKLIFPVILNLFYNIKATSLILSWEQQRLRWYLDRAVAAETLWGCRLAGLHAFTPSRKRPGNFPLCAFSHAVLSRAEAILQTEENAALNAGAGARDRICSLDRLVHFPDKAGMSSAFPRASSILGVFLCFCCPGFFRGGINQVFYLLVNDKNLAFLSHTVFLATGNFILLVYPSFGAFVFHNVSLLGNLYLIYIRWALSICMVPITVVSEHQSDSFLFPFCLRSGLACFTIVSCVLNTCACVCRCVCLNELQHFTELADFRLYQAFSSVK